MRVVSHVRRMLWAMTVAFCVLLSTPGASEGLVDAIHELTDSHTAHADSKQHCHGDSPEHGCSGLFHLCGCCGHVHALTSSFTPRLIGARGAEPRSVEITHRAERLTLLGYHADVYRPPAV